MKKLIIMMIALIAVTAVSAQKVAVNMKPKYGGVYRPHSTVVVRGSYYPYYRPYYSPYYRPYWYGSFYRPFPTYYRQDRPTKLDLQVEDIKNEYDDRIWSVRHNDDLSGKEKRQQVRELKQERDDAIEHARKNYYIKE